MTTTETGSTELLPCPFCGGTQSQLQINTYAGMSWVACPSCGLEAPPETGVSAEAAVAYWNTRPLRNAQSEAVAVAEPLHLTEYEIQVLLGCSISGCPMSPDRVFSLPTAWHRLFAMGLIDRTDGLAVITAKGRAIIDALTRPAPPLAVTDEMVDGRKLLGAINKLPRRVIEVHDNNGDVFVSLHKVRAALTAALEAKQ